MNLASCRRSPAASSHCPRTKCFWWRLSCEAPAEAILMLPNFKDLRVPGRRFSDRSWVESFFKRAREAWACWAATAGLNRGRKNRLRSKDEGIQTRFVRFIVQATVQETAIRSGHLAADPSRCLDALIVATHYRSIAFKQVSGSPARPSGSQAAVRLAQSVRQLPSLRACFLKLPS